MSGPTSNGTEPTFTDASLHEVNDIESPIDDAAADQEGIVSVNEHGRSGTNTAAKIAFVVACIAILAVSGIAYWNSKRADEKLVMEQEKKSQREARKTVVVKGKERQFSEIPPTPAELDEKTHGANTEYAVPSPEKSPLDENTNPVSLSGSKGTKKERSRYSGGIIVATGSSASAARAEPVANTDSRRDQAYEALSRALGGSGSANGISQAETSSSESNDSEKKKVSAKDKASKVSATMIGDRSMLLPKGRSIDCILTTRIVSELPGFVGCVLQSDVYSDDDRVKLLEKGSEATGKYGNTVANGQHRIFVLWDRIKTPTGVIINLDSPGTDSLGTSGLPGFVDNRWLERIGSAFMLSIVKDLIAYKIAKDSDGSAGSIAYSDTASTGDRMTEMVLKDSMNIKPTLYKNQGETLSIYVARDLDFSDVYRLAVH